MAWEAVDYKLEQAEFFLRTMEQAIIPRRLNAHQVAQAAAGNVVIGNPWDQEGFFHYLDGFLSACRSIPDVIEAQFGRDHVLGRRAVWWRRLLARLMGAPAGWFQSLSEAEQKRRNKFSRTFQRRAKNVRKHWLSHARNLTIHRTGVPPVEVEVRGRWGVVRVGGPGRHIEEAEAPPEPPPGAGGLPVGLPRHYVPVVPRAGDFQLLRHDARGAVVRQPMFPTCADYLRVTRALVAEARALDQTIHAGQPLTPPPPYELP